MGRATWIGICSHCDTTVVIGKHSVCNLSELGECPNTKVYDAVYDVPNPLRFDDNAVRIAARLRISTLDFTDPLPFYQTVLDHASLLGSDAKYLSDLITDFREKCLN
jgi:hypothetical protein